jgi:hypothetical protein
MPVIFLDAVFVALASAAVLGAVGWALLRPFERALAIFGPGFRPVAAGVLGYAGYSACADVALKLFGPNWLGFVVAPLAALLLFAGLLEFFRDDAATPTPVVLDLTGGQRLFALLFAFVVALQVVPLRFGENVYWGTPEIDWRSRLGVIHAIARDGLPAANPFFDPTGESKLFFYYGFFLLPAACVALANVDPATVLAVLVLLLAYGVAATAAALGSAAVGHARGGWTALCLCFVTGLDLLPVLALIARKQEPMSVEWWNPAQITALTASPVWAPHHTVAVLQVLLAHMLAWQTSTNRTHGRWSMAAMLGLLLAGAGMTSTYVALLGFASLGLQAGWKLLRDDSRGTAVSLLVALATGAGCCVPFYAGLARFDEHGGQALAPILRPCPGEPELKQALVNSTGLSPAFATFLVRAFGLIPQYFIELGVLFFVLIFWRRTGVGVRASQELWRSLATMTATAFVIGSVLVSVRTWNCDLNWRIMHPVQIVLVGAAAAFWQDFVGKRRPAFEVAGLAFVAAVGLLGTIYDVYRARFDYLVRTPANGRWAGVAERAAAVANAEFPTSARVLIVPSRIGDVARNGFWGHYLRHRLILSDADFNAFPYGPKRADVDRAIADVERIFAPATPRHERWKSVQQLRADLIFLDDSTTVRDPAAFGPSAKTVAEDEDGAWRIVAVRPHELEATRSRGKP